MLRTILIITLLWQIASSFSIAQVSKGRIPDSARVHFCADDSLIFNDCKSELRDSAFFASSMNERNVRIAKYFIGKPYGAGTLESSAEGKVRINLNKLDCVTFLESVISLNLTFSADSADFLTYTGFIEKIRYRGGVLGEFPERLHYFSDWIYSKSQEGFVKNLSWLSDSTLYEDSIYYMTENRIKYPLMKSDSVFDRMKEVEAEINVRTTFYIPTNKINSVASEIKSGDIIGFTTNIKGLDIAHVGFAYWQNEKLCFIHASSSSKEVTISEKSIEEYVNSKKYLTGIMIARISGS